MKPCHWTKLSEELGIDFTFDDDVTLNDALKAGLEDRIEAISEFVSMRLRST
jgi:hypothetical protein